MTKYIEDRTAQDLPILQERLNLVEAKLKPKVDSLIGLEDGVTQAVAAYEKGRKEYLELAAKKHDILSAIAKLSGLKNN